MDIEPNLDPYPEARVVPLGEPRGGLRKPDSGLSGLPA